MDLNDCYKDQYNFNKMFLEKSGLNIDDLTNAQKKELLINYSMHLYREIGEVLNTFDSKMHRPMTDKFIRSNTLEELVDCFKFLMGMFQILGVDAKELSKAYQDKTLVVDQRWRQEMELKTLSKCEKVCAVDLDGVLGVYPDHWLNYLNNDLNSKFKTLEEAKINIDTIQYNKIKEKYRLSGDKINIPVMEGAKEFLSKLKDSGYMIVILTSRPYKKYFRIFSDTLHWLKNNELVYDSVIFDENKNMRILQEIPNLSFMVEDRIRYANSVAASGYRCYLIDKENKYSSNDVHENVMIIKDFNKILITESILNR